jgi:TRAP-type C4-dicarboxylate transport system substrate-binding protein
MIRRLILVIGLIVLFLVASSVVVGCGGDETTTTAAPPTTTQPATTAASSTDTTAGSGTTAVSVEPIVFKWGFVTCESGQDNFTMYNYPYLFERVEEATGGKYKFDITYYAAGVLMDVPQNWDGVVQGIAQVGMNGMGFNPDQFPVMQTLTAGGISEPKNARAATHAAVELYAKYQPAEFSSVHVLGWYATGPGWIHSKKPLESLEQMQGLRVKVGGTSSASALALGIDAIVLPMSEAYDAASKGVIDAVLGPPELLDYWSMHELFDYSTFAAFLYPSEIFWIAMNLDTWNSLPEDLKIAFDAVQAEFSAYGAAIQDSANDKGIAVAEAEGGHQWITLSEADQAKINEVLTPIREDRKAMLDGAGLPAQQIIDDAVDLVDKANQLDYEDWKEPQ